MRMRNIAVLLLIALAVIFSGCAVYQKADGTAGSPMLIKGPDGTLYKNISAGGPRPIKIGKAIGSLNLFGGTVYEVEGDPGRNALYVQETLGDMPMFFCRESIQVPAFTSEEIDYIQWDGEDNTYARIDDAQTIQQFIQISHREGQELISDNIETVAYINCYMKVLPGCAYQFYVYEQEGALWIDGNGGLIRLDENIVNAIKH